jgi:hypothetical protein
LASDVVLSVEALKAPVNTAVVFTTNGAFCAGEGEGEGNRGGTPEPGLPPPPAGEGGGGKGGGGVGIGGRGGGEGGGDRNGKTVSVNTTTARSSGPLEGIRNCQCGSGAFPGVTFTFIPKYWLVMYGSPAPHGVGPIIH